MPECLGREGVRKPSTLESTDEAVDMTLTPTVEVIGTSLVTRKCKGIIHIQTLPLKYRLS